MQRATMPLASSTSGVMGTGVEVYDIIQIRSSYLDNKYWGQNRSYSEWQVKQDNLEEMEGIFNEPSDTGVRKVMDEFFTALDELSKKPSDNTCRVAVIEKANILTASINRNGHELINNVRDVNFDIKAKVEEINSLSARLASLNQQIFNFELGGHKANDLRDQRNVLVDDLSSLVNVSVSEVAGPNGNNYFDVKISGISLVSHTSFNKITTVEKELVTAQKNGISDMGGGKISQVVWEGMGNQPVRIEGGELKGLLDIRDGDGVGTNYRGLPYYLNKLNEFAADFASKFNEQHAAGTDLSGNYGKAFFNLPDSPAAINCLNFSVSKDLVANPNLIAASSAGNGESNNENVRKLIEFRSNSAVFTSAKGTPDDFIKAMLSSLAVDSSQAKRMTQNYETMVNQTLVRRTSESGVSLDEEMSNLVKYEQAYKASARLITTLESVLDTTINRLGLVGR